MRRPARGTSSCASRPGISRHSWSSSSPTCCRPCGAGIERGGDLDMSARLLNGTEIARQLRADLAARVAAVTAKLGRPPGLCILLVGHDPGSEIYVRNKGKAASELGIRADTERLPESARLDEVLAIVRRLNASPVHDAILVQSPLPAQMGSDAEQRVFDTIAPASD